MEISKNKILYVTHEMTPYMEMTGMADTARLLPQHMQEKGMEVRVFMPRFGSIKERKHRLHEVIRLSGINIPVGEDDNPLIIKVASLPSAKMQIYFLDNEDYFNKRGYLATEDNKFFPDNDERVIFFNKGVIEIIMKLGWIPDIIHCHGWMASLVPMYIRTVAKNEPVFKNTRIVYSIYESDFKQTLGKEFAEKALIPGQSKHHMENLEDPGCSELYLSAVNFADAIVLGSPEIPGEVSKCINRMDKPVIAYQDPKVDNYAESIYDLYQSLAETEVLEKH
ncbi:MAG: glycogen/starch synthase [Bacteroidota bacterium]|nr:glycogen/starch synthase [Bacteroidota bacterium]